MYHALPHWPPRRLRQHRLRSQMPAAKGQSVEGEGTRRHVIASSSFLPSLSLQPLSFRGLPFCAFPLLSPPERLPIAAWHASQSWSRRSLRVPPSSISMSSCTSPASSGAESSAMPLSLAAAAARSSSAIAPWRCQAVCGEYNNKRGGAQGCRANVIVAFVRVTTARARHSASPRLRITA